MSTPPSGSGFGAVSRAGRATGRRIDRRSGRAIIVFCVLACVLAWVPVSPLWLGGDGLDHPQGRLLIGLMMFTPAMAAFIVLRFVDRPASIPRATGMTPLRPAGRLLRYCACGLVFPPIVMLGGVLLATAAGAYQPDLANFSGFRVFAAGLGLTDADGQGVPLGALGLLAALQLVGVLLSLPMMFGEEWGWRGYLLPALVPMGVVPAAVAHGVVWGVWHAPIILLGYNFGRPDLIGLGAMTALSVLLGAVLAWLRLASGSLWPAVIAHGAFNNSTAIVVVFSDADAGLGTSSTLPSAVWAAIGACLLTLIAVGYAVHRIRSSMHPNPHKGAAS
ncbi:CPBP family intramembrane metalloprotease domain-containing protein [Nocardiopsis gilva YIM 90087]|uniref:CPBP family intramembrane metalloprotease domain-containing protein n=1 Tax=Nocardiopsis gilva YIM 90087 TaxID=1235441 RepID=A0A223SAY6_9ACTN|nr:CPBP family intramembrane glutamic endopeptidase [Nocardiopsis gilva]ASU85334.1 CPBP family intramembrane metalloprotease domain-containing protein [Nocardiopsis gilva YIM 90087]